MIDQELRTHVGNLLTDIKDAMNQNDPVLAQSNAARLAALLGDATGVGSGWAGLGQPGELADLKRSHGRLEKQLEEAQLSATQAHRMCEEAKGQHGEANKHVAQLEKAMGEAGRYNKEHQLAEARARVADLTSDRNKYSQDLASLRADHELVKKQLAEAELALASLKKAYAEVCDQLARSGKEVVLLRSVAKDQQATIASLRREHKLMADKIDKLENALATSQGATNAYAESAAARFKANSTPAPDHHNARRLAWREYATQRGMSTSDTIDWADEMLEQEEKRFGPVR